MTQEDFQRLLDMLTGVPSNGSGAETWQDLMLPPPTN